ncbi:MAG: hypothetical protein DWI58_02000 [Chloroflexi bacterium]|nr:MAG: hypothetical protein DWI58_02000 [Chloroflexota bacterium]
MHGRVLLSAHALVAFALSACADVVRGTVLQNTIVCDKPNRDTALANCTEMHREITVQTDSGETRILTFDKLAYLEVPLGSRWPTSAN